jgi:hypothetical protein
MEQIHCYKEHRVYLAFMKADVDLLQKIQIMILLDEKPGHLPLFHLIFGFFLPFILCSGSIELLFPYTYSSKF